MKRLPVLVLLLSCGTPPGVEDAGMEDVDAGGLDAGERDAGEHDAGAPDSGSIDAGPADSGTADAGIPDAGIPDAGIPDAGIPDAGIPDAGPPPPTCTANGIPGTCLDVSVCTGTRQPTPGLCPGPANIQCCTPRYANSCDPNVRPEPNAGLTEDAPDSGCPGGMVQVSTFCIDRYEASLDEVLQDGGTRPWSPFHNPGTTRVRARSLRGATPQGYISGLQAADACLEAGKRLCTDAEWLRACRGPGALTYPYGSTRMPGVCNDARSVHPAIELYGTSASWIYSHIDSPCLNQLDAGLLPTAAKSGCLTAEGLHDMMGNLHEWTADPAGTFRGGFYVDTVINGNGCLYVTTAHTTSHWDYSTGFRCCL